MTTIAIVGGGPAGLALAALLQQKEVDFSLFERRARPTPEELAAPSGMLDLHQESGLAAIDACGLTDEFLKHTGDFSQAMTVMNQAGAVVYSDTGNDGIGGDRPEIPRHALLGLFLSRIEPGRIHWQHKLTAATKTDANTVQLVFNDGVHREFDFVVGADGAWSRVRALLTSRESGAGAVDAAKPEYSGLQYVTATVRDVARRFPHLVDAIGTGMFFALGNGAAVIGHRGVHDTERLYLTVPAVSDTGGLRGLSPQNLKTTLLGDAAYFGAWWPAAQELMAAGLDDEQMAGAPVEAKPMYRLRPGYRWPTDACATLVGDAAHLMLPYAGEGVNLALWDVLQLSDVLAAERRAGSGGGCGNNRKERLPYSSRGAASAVRGGHGCAGQGQGGADGQELRAYVWRRRGRPNGCPYEELWARRAVESRGEERRVDS